ncbi:MAG: flagellar biosynthesis protein FlhF [Aquificaceae bacterium]|nr:flagellar biosynthesis protein FlhF [Aquificaceae bacterium]
MKIKKLLVDSLQEAVEEVRVLYGSEAVILSTRVVKQDLVPFLPFLKRSKLEITVGIPDKEDFAKELNKEESLYQEISKLKENLKEVMEMVKKQKTEKEEVKKDDLEGEYSIRALYLMNKLINRGVSRDIAQKIVESACGYDFELKRLDLKGENLESLVEGFSKNLKIVDNFFDNDFSVIALLGPTGVGKTTTIAKLAYRFKMAGKRVGLITIDSYRVGAVEQLRTYANIMELPFRVADTPHRLRECIGELSSLDTVLVDTGGRSHYNQIRVKELSPFFARLPALKIYITLGANVEERVQYEVIESFSVAEPAGIIFTKMDETGYFGTTINVAYRTQLPILCFTTGQRVPEDIVMASYEYIAKLFLEVV